MREKLLNLMKSEGLTSSRLAEILEIQPSGVSHILSGRNKPGFDLLQKILRRFPRINPDWLLLDSEQMFRDESTVQNTQRRADLFADHAPQPEPHPQQDDTSSADIESFSATISTKAPDSSTERSVERVVIFFDDHTFESFTPKGLK